MMVLDEVLYTTKCISVDLGACLHVSACLDVTDSMEYNITSPTFPF